MTDFGEIAALANTVLFEGYCLYPYRPSALKNRRRWNFGTLWPEPWAQGHGEPSRAGVEILLETNTPDPARLAVLLRFLLAAESQPSEREFGPFALAELNQRPLATTFGWKGALRGASEGVLGELAVAREALGRDEEGREVSRLRIEIRNSLAAEADAERDSALGRAMLSAHLLLALEGGSFLSRQDPPPRWRAATAACQHLGLFPALVGDPERRDQLLAAPIALEDYPRLAAESAGDFFDATEMDEMLALRVATLTPQEKEEMRRGDPRAAAILARVESLSPEAWVRLHGGRSHPDGGAAERDGSRHRAGSEPAAENWEGQWEECFGGPRVEAIRIGDQELRTGDAVRLKPRRAADIFDLELAGREARIEAIEQETEGRILVAVVVADDPGRDLGMERQPGHRFFFGVDEIEPLTASAPRILIAGVGNIFLGDDAFGCELAKRAAALAWPEGVVVRDFGIRALDLAYELIAGWDQVILLDAAPRGAAPGTLRALELPAAPAGADALEAATPADPHSLTPNSVLALAAGLGGPLAPVTLLGCEPSPWDETAAGSGEAFGLSAPVAAALPAALEQLEQCVNDARNRRKR